MWFFSFLSHSGYLYSTVLLYYILLTYSDPGLGAYSHVSEYILQKMLFLCKPDFKKVHRLMMEYCTILHPVQVKLHVLCPTAYLHVLHLSMTLTMNLWSLCSSITTKPPGLSWPVWSQLRDLTSCTVLFKCRMTSVYTTHTQVFSLASLYYTLSYTLLEIISFAVFF